MDIDIDIDNWINICIDTKIDIDIDIEIDFDNINTDGIYRELYSRLFLRSPCNRLGPQLEL